MPKITEEEAIALLKKHSKDKKSFEKILEHSKAVQGHALEIASEVPNIDEDYIRIGSLLHDIGRFECHQRDKICHGIKGADILRKEGLDEFAQLAETHIGAGISAEDIKKQDLKLPIRDYIPIKKEDKIIAHADNLIKGNKRISLKQAVDRFNREVGKKAGDKVKSLGEEVEGMKK